MEPPGASECLSPLLVGRVRGWLPTRILSLQAQRRAERRGREKKTLVGFDPGSVGGS